MATDKVAESIRQYLKDFRGGMDQAKAWRLHQQRMVAELTARDRLTSQERLKLQELQKKLNGALTNGRP
jgi:hypothetical protein